MSDTDAYYPHEFRAVISRHMLGTLAYTVVYLDPALAAELGWRAGARVRASGELRDMPFAGAWQPSRGRWYLMLSKRLMREGEFALGDEVACRFRVEPDDAVDVPEVLASMLVQNRRLRTLWEGLTPGARRGLAHRVATAKTPATIQKRLKELRDHLTGVKPLRGLGAKGRTGKR